MLSQGKFSQLSERGLEFDKKKIFFPASTLICLCHTIFTKWFFFTTNIEIFPILPPVSKMCGSGFWLGFESGKHASERREHLLDQLCKWCFSSIILINSNIYRIGHDTAQEQLVTLIWNVIFYCYLIKSESSGWGNGFGKYCSEALKFQQKTDAKCFHYYRCSKLLE